ncbi:MAG TPA: ATP-binding protein, partial [Chloroflexota bacterium]|nr:ATP-binding protein [Chloroflexota bacterium]
MLTPLDSPIVCPITVGREPHIAAADRLLDQLVSGQGQTLLITGEAGIGKSRLVSEIKTRAIERRCRVIQSECFETDRALPYAPFLELHRELLPDFVETPTGVDPEQRKRRLFQAVTDSLAGAARERPLLMVIEDVHWADETSLECCGRWPAPPRNNACC